jgi:alpha-galactosidase
MNESGLVALGYNTFILDDCYTEINRSSTGEMVQNFTRFPGGMKLWTQSINAYGVSGSAYSSNGYHTCAGYPGVCASTSYPCEKVLIQIQGLRT